MALKFTQRQGKVHGLNSGSGAGLGDHFRVKGAINQSVELSAGLIHRWTGRHIKIDFAPLLARLPNWRQVVEQGAVSGLRGSAGLAETGFEEVVERV